MATLHSDMLLRVTGKTKAGYKFCNYFVPKKDIMRHLDKDGKTVSLTHFKAVYVCDGMFKKGFEVEKVTLVSDFIQSGPFTMSGLSEFDCEYE
jgi:hypothetical protein